MFEKLSFLSKRIFKMDYKGFFDVIERIHKKTKTSKIILFFDIIICGIKYQAGYLDYELFEMYNLNAKQRATVVTRGINNHLVKKYNNPDYVHIFVNKDEFNKKFDKFLKRDWLILNGNNEAEFNEFIKDKNEIIAKPIDGIHGQGVTKIKPDKNTYSQLVQQQLLLVEEVIEQVPELNTLNPTSVNTIRVITLGQGKKREIVLAYLRIGNNKIVDNFCGGGMVAPININTHVIDFPATDKVGNVFYKHPTTQTDIVGFEIPYFDEIKKLVYEASEMIPEVSYVGWDVALSTKGPCLVEGNEFPGHVLYQLPPHRANGIGVLPIFQKVLSKQD